MIDRLLIAKAGLMCCRAFGLEPLSWSRPPTRTAVPVSPPRQSQSDSDCVAVSAYRFGGETNGRCGQRRPL